MTFTLDSLKDSLLKMDTLIEKENQILIEELNLPNWFDSRTHYLYLPMHMKEKFKDQDLPDFMRFSDSVPFDQMFVAAKDLYTNYWSFQ